MIIPDGILARVGGKKLRDHILRECYLDAIVSFPVRTFFANCEHTYVLAVTKKNSPDDAQKAPVFTYLVSNIGERLTSVRREDIEADDLPEMESLFRIFVGAPEESKPLLEKQFLRCKVQDIKRFQTESHWVIDRWWTKQERIDAGIDEDTNNASKSDVDKIVEEFNAAVSDYDLLVSKNPLLDIPHREVTLRDTSLFRTFIGKRVLLKDITDDESKIPLYSANAIQPMGYVGSTRIKDFSCPAILWGIDNSLFNYKLIPANQPFATTDHCGAIQILDPNIVPEYVLYALCLLRSEKTFDRSFRSSLTNMRLLNLTIPIKPDNSFDIQAQEMVAKRFTTIEEHQKRLSLIKNRLDEVFSRYVVLGNWH